MKRTRTLWVSAPGRLQRKCELWAEPWKISKTLIEKGESIREFQGEEKIWAKASQGVAKPGRAWLVCTNSKKQTSAAFSTCDLHEWNPVGRNSFSMWIGIIKAKTALDRVIERCGWEAHGAPARHQGCASEVGEPTSGHWSTRDLSAPRNTKWRKSPRDLHLNTKTQLHSTTSKLQCWTPYAKQLARKEHSPIH